MLSSWLWVCFATGVGLSRRKRHLGKVGQQGGWPLREWGSRLDWTEGPFSGEWKGTGKGALGTILQICAPPGTFSQEDSKPLKGCLYSRVRESREPLGDLAGHPCAWTSRLLPANATVVGELQLASLPTQTTFFSKPRPAFKCRQWLGHFLERSKACSR